VTGRVRDTVSTARPSERTGRDVHPARLGAYRLFERLGSGGQAFVYRAQRIGDPDACDVALKRLHPHLTDDDAAVRSFGREARIAYLLDHPVIRRVFSLCREPGELFMIMEYVNGVSVNNVLKRASAARRHLPVHGILALLHRLCGALHHAHELVDERGAAAGLVRDRVWARDVREAAGPHPDLLDADGGLPEAGPAVRAGGAFAAYALGFLAPGLAVQVFRSNRWTRLTAPGGHVLMR
jgi:serine/threonine protein kinase